MVVANPMTESENKLVKFSFRIQLAFLVRVKTHSTFANKKQSSKDFVDRNNIYFLILY